MLKQIEKLQTKSVNTRKKIAFGISVVVIVVIFFVWVSTLDLGFREDGKIVEDGVYGEELDAVSPFETLKGGLTDIIDQASDKFIEVKDMMAGATSSTEDDEETLNKSEDLSGKEKEGE